MNGENTMPTNLKDHPLWHPEFIALLARHNRMEGKYPFERYPHDMAGIIADWLRDHSEDSLAEGVLACDPWFLSSYIWGCRSVREVENMFLNSILGTTTHSE